MFGRRRFVGAALAAAGAYTFDAGSVARLLPQAPCTDSGSEGELLGTLPLTGDQPRQTPFGEAVGGPGLDTRVFTDLSKVGPDHLITPADQVFVRTAPPAGIAERQTAWTITLAGNGAPATLTAAELRRRSGAAGRSRLVWLRVDEMGARDPPGRRRRTGDVADGGVRRPDASGRTAVARSRV